MQRITTEVAKSPANAPALPVEIIQHILLYLDAHEVIHLQTVQFLVHDNLYLISLPVPRFRSSSMLLLTIQYFGGLCTPMPTCLDPLGLFLGSRPSSSNGPSFTQNGQDSVGSHNR